MPATLDAWLEPRLADAPAELAAAVRELLRETGARLTNATGDAVEIPERLAAAALRGFDGMLDGAAPARGSRQAALRLLAADAALTYAFEAAAGLGLDVVALAGRLGPRGELGARLTGRAGPSGSSPAGAGPPDSSPDSGGSPDSAGPSAEGGQR